MKKQSYNIERKRERERAAGNLNYIERERERQRKQIAPMQKLPITGETESANDCQCNREGGRESARERYATIGERSERGEREG